MIVDIYKILNKQILIAERIKLPIGYGFTEIEKRVMDIIEVACDEDNTTKLIWRKVNYWYYPYNDNYSLQGIKIGLVKFPVWLKRHYVDIVTKLNELLLISDKILTRIAEPVSPIVLFMQTRRDYGQLPGSKYKWHKTIIGTLKKVESELKIKEEVKII